MSPERILNLREQDPDRIIVLGVGLPSYYDAAGSTTESDFGTFLGSLSEDYHFCGSVRWTVIGRIRREVRNNCYLAGLVQKFPEAIGHVTLRSRTSSKDYNSAKDTFWHRLAKRVTPCGDSLRTVADVLKIECLVAGEIFFVKLPNGLLQPVPSEFCGSNAAVGLGEVDANGLREVNGILYGPDGAPRFYRFGRLTTAGLLSYTDSELVPAEHVIHVFAKDRVLMGRGLPWLLPCLRPAHDLYEITRAKTKQIKDVTSIFGTLEKANAAEALNGMAAPELDSAGEPVAETADSAADTVRKGPVKVELRPGTFIALEPGEKLNKLTSEYQAADYKELIMLMLHAISSPIGLPVELWFSGLGDVNYSGFKGLGVQWNARRRHLIEFLEEKFFQPFHDWRVDYAEKLRQLPRNPDADHDLIDWRWRRTPVLDDEKEARSNKVRLESGELSLLDIWEERGLYAEEVIAARREFWIKLKIAAGELEESPGGDYADVKVPLGFLLRGELPGTTSYPYLPDGTGRGEDWEPSTPEEEAAAQIAAQQAARLAVRSLRQMPPRAAA